MKYYIIDITKLVQDLYVEKYTMLMKERTCTEIEIFPMDRRAWWAAIYGLHRIRHNWSDLAAAAAAAFMHYKPQHNKNINSHKLMKGLVYIQAISFIDTDNIIQNLHGKKK